MNAATARRRDPGAIIRALAAEERSKVFGAGLGVALAPGEDFSRYYDDVAGFAFAVLGVRLYMAQRDIAADVARCDQVAVAAAQKTGKSKLLAVLALWYVATRPRGKVRFMSATYDQVIDPLWSELTELYTPEVRRRLGGPEMLVSPRTGLRWPDGRRIDGRNPSRPDAAGGFSGTHLLYLIDEASGVREQMFVAASGNRIAGYTEGTEAKLVLTGNPLRTSGKFFRAFTTERDVWSEPRGALHQLSAHDSPNVTGEMAVPGLATRGGIEEALREVGGDEKHADYQARVLGKFPTAGSNNVVSLDLIADGHDAWRTLAVDAYDEAAKPTAEQFEAAVDAHAPDGLALGVDPARFGDDRFVTLPLRGRVAYRAVVEKHLDEEDGAKSVLSTGMRMRRPGEVVTVNVDGHGVGSGVVSSLRVLVREMERRDANEKGRWIVNDVRSGDPASQPDKFANKRAQMCLGVAKWLREGGALPKDAQMETELLAATYSYDNKGRQVVEPKDDIKARLKRSPDLADALALAIHVPRARKPDTTKPRNPIVNFSYDGAIG